MCGEVKAAKDFYCDCIDADGLLGTMCCVLTLSDSLQICLTALTMLQECKMCGEVKAADDYYHNRTSADWLFDNRCCTYKLSDRCQTDLA